MATKTKSAKKRETPPIPPGCAALLSKVQICFLLNCSARKLAEMRSRGEFPAPDRSLGKLLRWRQSTVNAWIEANAEKATEAEAE